MTNNIPINKFKETEKSEDNLGIFEKDQFNMKILMVKTTRT